LATAYGGKGLTMLEAQPRCNSTFAGDVWMQQILCQDYSHQHFSTDFGRHRQHLGIDSIKGRPTVASPGCLLASISLARTLCRSDRSAIGPFS